MIRIILLVLVTTTSTLCVESKRYDQVTWLCTHNAMNAADDSWKIPNQNHTIAKQLDNGVRALMLDVHLQEGVIVLRHGPPMARMFGSKPFVKELETVRTFLEKDKEAVVTLILESYVPAMDVAALFKTAKLEAYCHSQPVGKPWPTLEAMRKSGKRLVVFSDRVKSGAAPAWYMHVWQHGWETDWEAETQQDLLAAKPRRGDVKNPLFILNHFITKGVPSRKLSLEANSNPFLQKRIDLVVAELKKKPNFLVLDFYDLGDGRMVVDALNSKKVGK